MTEVDWVSVGRPRALDGYLQRYRDGWYWVDGTFEPRAHDLRLADTVPSHRWRKVRVRRKFHMDIPHNWRHDVDHKEASSVMAEVIKRYGQPIEFSSLSKVRREGRNAEPDTHGYRLPLSTWNAYMLEVIGTRWSEADDGIIMGIYKILRAQNE